MNPSNAELQDRIAKLEKINTALMDRVERSMDHQGDAFSLFQTAINLEDQIRQRTKELTTTLGHLESSNQALIQAKEQAENANLSKTRFLAAASHDVLQPLNAALLLVSSLHVHQTNDEGKRLCHQVERSLETMGDLLRELLYMSRLDTGDVKPKIEPVCLDDLFDSIASDFQPVADLQGLDLRVRRCGLHVYSDSTMLRRVLQNIVSNALRYTKTGGVLLIAAQLDNTVIIRIADTGIGISKDRHDKIFNEFYRGNSAKAVDPQASAGFGLGLAIVARMVRTLDHAITLNSRIDHGSTFKLALEAAPPIVREMAIEVGRKAVNATGWSTHQNLAGTRILLVENDMEVMQAMDALLLQWGCEIRMGGSTKEALEALAPDGWVPDIIVADQHLDNSDLGTSTIKLTRSLAGAQLPAVIITANPSKTLAQTALRSDIDVMHKPVKPAELRALLMHLKGDRKRLA